ncbi:DUF5397 family protein [Acidithiobacillus ferridurans]|uniref:DUF5397 family protein n=1 Tax=Acidithiobacillus ferridurans TaxID=1232575 RepID=A0A8X8G762_ACIFI|nr:DUF5397 family protein [Acidithiobacillus ferridurans]MBU2715837.1 DUF5397 family protein [Acidithiobacillus ferridurans]MBU2722834.1 DUF5397 family protein [Acidithiobacillus ferridurans]MBU2727779.1 DUF5397 family protein [Acidithiobacillus ferridurans]
MSKETDELVDSITNIGKYLIKRVVDAAHDVEKRVEPSEKLTPSPVTDSVDFHIGEWRRFTEAGEAYQVVAPIKCVGDDWIMRIQLKDGSFAEYLLSRIRKNPPLQGADPF